MKHRLHRIWLAGVAAIVVAASSTSLRADAPPRDAIPMAVPALPSAYPPADECAMAGGWKAFRAKLERAVSARDSRAFVKLAVRDVELDFGGGSGRAELRNRLDDPQQALWGELDALLTLGCAMRDNQAAMPWWFWNAPEHDNPFATVLVLGSDTPLLDKPDGKAIAVAGWQSAELPDEDYDPDARFIRIKLANGQIGWVATRRLRGLLDYRLIAERVRGRWQITRFIAGD